MAKNPTPSQLDPGQIVKRAYDESTDRWRVDAAITAPSGTSILIDATTDSIKVGNTSTGPFLNVNADGSINTTTTSVSALSTFQTTQYSVGTTAVQLAPTALTGRKAISIKAFNTAGNYVYVGNSSAVTTTSGYLLGSLDSISLDLGPAQGIWAIASAAGQTVFVMEIA